MGLNLTAAQIAAYDRDGYVSPIRVMSEDAAAELRARLEAAEAKQGGPMAGALRFKPHILYTFLDDLVRDKGLLDAVEDVLGPDILCWASSFFTKEAHDPGFVSWHQDSTYWGLSTPEITTAWVALSPSTPENGCMRVIPGTHTAEQFSHTDTHHESNMLSRGQVIDTDVDESKAADIVLKPGEMSLHHVRLIHGSEANRSEDRRIGFAIRYIPPHLRQVNGPHDAAALVRGEDTHGHFEVDPSPVTDLDPDAVAYHARITELHGQLLYQGTRREPFS
jgi:non-haem Fe2+, alpha-ketoglutarate-dependent halogenase